MAKINFSDLKLEVKEITTPVQIGDITLQVRSRISMHAKEELFNYVISNSIDPTTNTFSPLRIEVYWAIAACKYYGQIEFTEEEIGEKLLDTYDALDSNGIILSIIECIEPDELSFMQEGIDKLCEAIERYATSFAGQISSMNTDMDNFNKNLEDIVSKIKNREGIELLEEIHSLESK